MDYAIIKPKTIVPLSKLSSHYPFVVNQGGQEKGEIINFIIGNNKKVIRNNTDSLLYYNYLLRYSKLVNIASSLYRLHKNDELIEVKSRSLPAFLSFFFQGIKVDFSGNENQLLDANLLKKIFFKGIVHKTYGFFMKRRLIQNSNLLIKSYVEISTKLHADDISSSKSYCYLVYPFLLNYKRQINFIMGLFNRRNRFSLCGFDYDLKKIFCNILFRKHSSDIDIIQIEVRAVEAHIKKIGSRAGKTESRIKTILTTDEFEPYSFYYYQQFRKKVNGLRVKNVAHGAGIYCKYIDFDEFLVFTERQERFYENPFGEIKFSRLPFKEKPTNGSLGLSEKDNSGRDVVWIFQSVENLGLNYEARLQEFAIKRLSDVLRFRGSTLKVKLHPNTKRRARKKVVELLNECGAELIEKFEGTGYIFFTMYSTAYFDFSQYGRFFFVKDRYFSGSNLFDEDIKIIDINNIDEVFKK